MTALLEKILNVISQSNQNIFIPIQRVQCFRVNVITQPNRNNLVFQYKAFNVSECMWRKEMFTVCVRNQHWTGEIHRNGQYFALYYITYTRFSYHFVRLFHRCRTKNISWTILDFVFPDGYHCPRQSVSRCWSNHYLG